MSESLPESSTYLDLAAAARRIPSRSFFSTGSKSSPEPDSSSHGLAFLAGALALGLAGAFLGFSSFSFLGFFSFGCFGPRKEIKKP